MSLTVQSAINSLEAPASDRLKPVRIWLYILAAMILLMVTIGGMTRLTDSGLSITSWKPISGMLPPLSVQDWQAEFDAYKQIPEFQQQNFWMDLEAFKSIFWWEWGHRFLGRVIGLAFAVPFVVFLFQRRLSWRLAPSLFTLFVLGGFQGFLGWWMVSSGLSERVDVSQYRLAAHLSAASILFVAIVWVAVKLTPQKSPIENTPSKSWQFTLWILALLVFLQIIMGAFVAGIDAGFGFNTWPLMEGKWIPDNLIPLSPVWLNMFENHLTVQFTHRMLGYLIAIMAIVMFAFQFGQGASALRAWVKLIFLMIIAQILLGILTLLLVVPIPLALLHQGLAFVALSVIVVATTKTS
ncbi:MAG: COX15/CtaA family protein [Devosiaceae bacterium]|nr:COX15/CtaA family protein [Devosiaceae bacterium]